jgi:hypothetical protein
LGSHCMSMWSSAETMRYSMVLLTSADEGCLFGRLVAEARSVKRLDYNAGA